MEFNAKQFLKAVGGQVLGEGKQDLCRGLSTDSRTLQLGELFFALKGPHFDGHKFCDAVIQKGAWGVVVEKGSCQSSVVSRQPWIFQMSDTLQALGDIARWWRGQFQIPVVAITGSNGKTTSKEMVGAILSRGRNILKTEGNFNNLIGLPLTLNRLDESHRAAVLEMGMNSAGEIGRLTEIAAPTVGLVTNAAKAHLEKLHTVEAVARAKSELYAAMDPKGAAVYNAEDPLLAAFVKDFKGDKISFGMGGRADVHFEYMECIGFDAMDLKLSIRKKILKAHLKTTGIHNIMNAMAACACALALEVPLEEMAGGLENFMPLKMRFEQIQLANGVRLVNDAYNANPLSMAAAFRTVGSAKRAGKFIAVLGDMKELGEESAALHEEVGRSAVKHGVERLLLLGDFAHQMAKGANQAGLNSNKVIVVQNEQEAVTILEKEMQPGDVVLVKASRAMRLETIVEELKERFGI